MYNSFISYPNRILTLTGTLLSFLTLTAKQIVQKWGSANSCTTEQHIFYLARGPQLRSLRHHGWFLYVRFSLFSPGERTPAPQSSTPPAPAVTTPRLIHACMFLPQVNSCTTEQHTPLHRAAGQGSKGAVAALLTHNAYVNAQVTGIQISWI